MRRRRLRGAGRVIITAGRDEQQRRARSISSVKHIDRVNQSVSPLLRHAASRYKPQSDHRGGFGAAIAYVAIR
jgi:hypothetical protein